MSTTKRNCSQGWLNLYTRIEVDQRQACPDEVRIRDAESTEVQFEAIRKTILNTLIGAKHPAEIRKTRLEDLRRSMLETAILLEYGAQSASPDASADDPGVCTTGQLLQQFRDRSQSLQSRGQAMIALLSEAPELVEQDVLRELEEAENLDWIAELLKSAEFLPLDSGAARTTARRVMLAGILRLRDSRSPAHLEGLWAGMRRYSGLLSSGDIEVFAQFLREADELKTKQLSLQCVQRILVSSTVAPPTGGSLRPRVRELALKFTDRELLGARENAALALNAMACLALLWPAEFVNAALPRAMKAQRPAFLRVLQRHLSSFLDRRGIAHQSPQVSEAIRRAIQMVPLL